IDMRTAIMVAILLAATLAAAQDPAAKVQPAPQVFVLAVSGNPGSPVYARRMNDWLTRFHAYLTGPAALAKENAIVLCGDQDLKAPFVQGPATAEAVKRAIATVAQKLRPDDQFILFLVGHGALEDPLPMLLLPGQDLSAKELAEALEAVPAENQVVLNFAGASGDFLWHLARRGRVNVAATSPGEEGEPVLCEFFLQALEGKQADGESPWPLADNQARAQPATDPLKPVWRTGNKDGQVSVLEAYNWAAHETAMWIARQKRADGEQWIVEGRQSVALFKRLAAGEDSDPGARKLSPQSDANAPDAVIPLAMKEGQDLDPWWIGRRTVLEHALLEDCGQEVGVSCLRGQGYEPLDGVKEGQPGWLARRVLLGRPALLPEERK
ncbi:MAG: hypothetical protein NTY19_46715, partial [Planctomycetota bacterium]|nr:hypothetical protein [Planctomycetota bacterium]